MSGIPYWAVRGVKVVCINCDGWKQMPGMPEMPAREPMANEVLTIRDVVTTDDFSRALPNYTFKEFATLLSFEEMGHDWLYASFHFRPIVTDDDKTEAKFYRTRKDKNVQRIPHFGPVS